MQIGDIILVSGNSFISKIIQKVTGSKWTHAALYVGGGNILEIDWNTRAAVIKKDYRELEYDYVVLRRNEKLTISQIRKLAISSLAHDKAGNRYDFFLLFSMLLKCLFPKGKLFRKFNKRNAYICTELIDTVKRDAGIVLFPNRKGDILPHEFLECEDLQLVESREN